MLSTRLPSPRRTGRPTDEIAMPNDQARWPHLAAAGLALTLAAQGNDPAALAAVSDPFDPPPMPRPAVLRPLDTSGEDDDGAADTANPLPHHLLPEEPQA